MQGTEPNCCEFSYSPSRATCTWQTGVSFTIDGSRGCTRNGTAYRILNLHFNGSHERCRCPSPSPAVE